MSRLLLLVDLQEDFLCHDGLSPHRNPLTERACLLLEHFRKEGAPIFHLRTKVEKTSDHRMPHWKAEDRWTCLEGSPGFLPPPILKEAAGEVVLHKTGFSFPSLVDVVAEQEAHEVVLCGVMLHACVRQAAVQLHEAGLKVVIADDAVGSNDPVHAAITRRYLLDRGVSFLKAAEISHLPDELGTINVFTRQTLEEKIAILSQSGPNWEETPFAERAQFAARLIDSLTQNAPQIADRIATDLGKPVRFGQVEMQRSAEMVEAIVSRLAKSSFERREGSATIHRRPLGTIAIITPWNNPVYIPLGKIIPALLCGNTVAWKPAPKAEGISEWLLSAMYESGIPENVLRLVPGDAETGRLLVENSGIGAVSITSSSTAGYSAGEACSRRHIPFQAELGGNNPAIVWTDCDPADAASKITAGAFEMAGQRCTANRRVVVPREIADEFVVHLVRAASRLCWGDPREPETHIGPLVDRGRAEMVQRCLDRASESGLSLHYPLGRSPAGTIDPTAGWCAPCIVECDDPNHELVQEELFAPILVVQRADNWQHALELANGVRQGLASALFSNDTEKISEFLSKACAGILKINSSTSDAAVDIPFGGWKASGTGPPEHGEADLVFYTRSQTRYSV